MTKKNIWHIEDCNEEVREETSLERIVEKLSRAELFIKEISANTKRIKVNLIGDVPECMDEEESCIYRGGKIGDIESRIDSIFRSLDDVSSVIYDISKEI